MRTRSSLRWQCSTCWAHPRGIAMAGKVRARVRVESIQTFGSHLRAQEERKRSSEREKHQLAVLACKVSSTQERTRKQVAEDRQPTRRAATLSRTIALQSRARSSLLSRLNLQLRPPRRPKASWASARKCFMQGLQSKRLEPLSRIKRRD